MTEPTLYTTSTNTSSGNSASGVVVGIILFLWSVIAFWKVFEKAKQPGWAAIIPFYNLYIMLKIVGRPGWWIILYIIPLVNIITHIVVANDFAKAFGKSAAFGFFGLWLFSLVGFTILGFGSAQYKGVPTH